MSGPKYIWTVCLSQKVPNVTTQRRSHHYMVVHAANRSDCVATCRELVQRRSGIHLDDSDFVKIDGGRRRA